jgi:hypothetical protein
LKRNRVRKANYPHTAYIWHSLLGKWMRKILAGNY